MHVLLFLGCAGTIYLACEAFVNAVEWLGVRMHVGSAAVGTILAAVGTALPESVVTLVAVLSGGDNGKAIGVGAALGGPLVVGTLAYATVGFMLLLRARSQPSADELAELTPVLGGTFVGHVGRLDLDGTDTSSLVSDQIWFVAIFVFKVALGLVAFSVKPWFGVLFLLAYVAYAYREMGGTLERASADGLEPLHLQRHRATPTTPAVVAQTVVALTVIFLASQLFVAQLDWAGPVLGLSPAAVALLLSPVATELPEILNAVIWIRQGKTGLALGNISGAMMIQATVPSALGMLFTPWLFDPPLLMAGVATMASIVYLITLFRRDRVTPGLLMVAGGFYVAFAAALTAFLAW